MFNKTSKWGGEKFRNVPLGLLSPINAAFLYPVLYRIFTNVHTKDLVISPWITGYQYHCRNVSIWAWYSMHILIANSYCIFFVLSLSRRIISLFFTLRNFTEFLTFFPNTISKITYFEHGNFVDLGEDPNLTNIA